MKIALALTAPALLLAGTALAQDAPYRAHGNSPDWSLNIDHNTIRYEGAHGHLRIVAPHVVARPSFNGMRYVTPRITVDVTYAPCDAGGGRIYHDRVTVETLRGRVTGCGGALVTAANPPRPPMGHGPGVASLDGSAWRIASVDGLPATTARPTTIRFVNGRVEGNAGCNSFGGNYDQRGPVLNASQIISTKMACVGPGMNIEGKVLRILARPATLAFRGGDTLVVRVPGSSMTLSRER